MTPFEAKAIAAVTGAVATSLLSECGMMGDWKKGVGTAGCRGACLSGRRRDALLFPMGPFRAGLLQWLTRSAPRSTALRGKDAQRACKRIELTSTAFSQPTPFCRRTPVLNLPRPSAPQ